MTEWNQSLKLKSIIHYTVLFVNLNLQPASDYLQLDCKSGQKSEKKPYSAFQPIIRSHVMLLFGEKHV